jgi:hypothetical protein
MNIMFHTVIGYAVFNFFSFDIIKIISSNEDTFSFRRVWVCRQEYGV